MKIVIFGLTMSSSWGNGHATIWRALCRALVRRGHRIIFFERDVPYYAAHRDLAAMPGMSLRLYADWELVRRECGAELSDADVGMVTSYCPDGIAAAELALSSRARRKVFYDLDTPVTLEQIKAGRKVAYVGESGYRDFDFVLSFTGGTSLGDIKKLLGARAAFPLYGCVDPDMHRRVPAVEAYRADLSYLGTYADDRQAVLQELFLEPARRLQGRRFVIGGSLYPQDFAWGGNVRYFHHVPPPEHPAFYSSSSLTLNITRGAMAGSGYCPSGRLFEAAACAVPVVSDCWDGLEQFFTPGREILTAGSTRDAVEAISLPRNELATIGNAARERTLDEHTGDRRALQLEALICSGSKDQ